MSPGALNNSNSRRALDGSSATEDVLIAGAGPAGLMLACTLARYGIRPKVLDDRTDGTSTGRADGLQPKSIETFRQLRLGDELLRKGVKVYDICFWKSTRTETLRRTARQVHYPEAVNVKDPYILLVHQGMVEDIFLRDMLDLGINVNRDSEFLSYHQDSDSGNIVVTHANPVSKSVVTSTAKFLIGCDGAHSRVRKSMPGVVMEGERSKAPWGVLDGAIDTDFPDLWSKVVIHSDTEGTILCIPRERGMTRLYIELNPQLAEDFSADEATRDFVINRAQKIISPFRLKWTTIEWFSVYKVGQRISSSFSNDSYQVLIAGDASHTHSPKAAQGMNTSMHDTFNLSWKLNLCIRGLAKQSLLETYEQERGKIAQDLIKFDIEHAAAFGTGDDQALAQNFDENINFISGAGVWYYPNVLNVPILNYTYRIKAGHLLPPGKLTRYIDANPVDFELDIPLLGQFRIVLFAKNLHDSAPLLRAISDHITDPSASVIGRATAAAELSYAKKTIVRSNKEDFEQAGRYTALSKLHTLALVTTMPKDEVEISDLPPAFQRSRWTFYLDDGPEQNRRYTERYLNDLSHNEAVLVVIRPDGYVGTVWSSQNLDVNRDEAVNVFLDEYFDGFLST
ncbi:FAD monooxygenase-like protein [Myriangium duriaei CBS 260.36]|uniref:FAD monooxygenase-like protein n=1 Tax=Myriangium duriaei CBS 260.36 TaxID=1168546 RepID=A0A9P4IQD7_9PEZI|nr:FAD monooxygenase-like protein [Myriangium duriaei CBS 260.36]